MTPIHQSIPSQSKVGNKRVILKHALIDVDFLHTPKIIALRRKFGDIAALAVIEITMQLSKATDATVELDTALAVVENFRIDKSEEFIAYCIDREILQKTELGFITEKGVIQDQQKLGEQQDKWKEKKRKQRQNEDVPGDMGGDTIGDSPGKSEQLNTEDLNSEDLNPNPKEGGQGETKPTQSSIVQNKPPKIQFGEHVFLTQTEIDNVQNKHGTAFFESCCEKLNAWIEQDPTPKRRKNGKNAGATFRAWVLNAVAEEEIRASRASPKQKVPYEKETNYDRNLRNILEA